MKNNSMSPTSIFLGHSFLLTIFLLLTQLSNVQCDATFIAKTCNKTPNYKLCVNYLNSDPRSSKATTAGLAIILVDIVKANATKTLSIINKMLPKSRGEQKKALKECAFVYDQVIIQSCIPEAYEALRTGNAKFAEDGTGCCAVSVESCESEFHGKSPLTKLNKAVHDTSAVARAIARLLL